MIDHALDHQLAELLPGWMATQRWYPAKGSDAGSIALERILDFGSSGQGLLAVYAVTVGGQRGQPQVLAVPLSLHAVATAAPGQSSQAAPETFQTAAVIGTVRIDQTSFQVCDATHDQAFIDALLRNLHRPDGTPEPELGRSTSVLTGEQSNTSVIVGADGPHPLMVKVFRALNPGRNPDVEVVGALSLAGCRRVAGLTGWLPGSWTAADGSAAHGDLAVAVEFLPGAQDAWREALAAAANGESFAEQARALGEATADVHQQLRAGFPTAPADDSARQGLITELRDRVSWALDSAPVLGRLRTALEQHRDRELPNLSHAPFPDLQRIHGDYHLGQVLHSPTRGWVLLDFEGEPLRPLADRVKPDLPTRDVVGMLRSFDYAAGHLTMHTTATSHIAEDWKRANQQAFLAGYTQVAGSDPSQMGEVFQALWLDKALYEVVYETRNRPEWIGIPLAAVQEALG